MAFVRSRARILEISTTSGSGPLALAGAADGSYNTFASFMSVGDQTFVTVVEPGVAFWSGIATYSAANQITLTTVEETKGTFGAGTKEVMASPLASSAMLREDISGAIVTGGTSTAYTVASYRKYGTLAELDGNIIAFTPHTTNGLGSPQVSLNVDGLGAKPLRADPVRALPPGVLVAGTPYTARYDHSSGLFLLHGVFGLPYNIPLGASLDYWGAAAPSSAFALAFGQAISRSTYSELFALISTTYGVGDGSTTFNIPDLRGRVAAGVTNMGGVESNRLSGATITTGGLGGTGGAPTKTLVTANLPPYTPAGSVSVTSADTKVPQNTGNYNGFGGGGLNHGVTGASGASTDAVIGPLASSGSLIGTAQGGTSTPFDLLQPTIMANKLLRII